MRLKSNNHNLFLLNALLFAFTTITSTAAAIGLLDHTLVEFRKVSQINLIVSYEKIQISTNDEIMSEMEILLDDLTNYNCTSVDCDTGKGVITAALLNKNSTLMSLVGDNDNVALKRKKREWDVFGKSLKWMGGVMDSDDRQILNRKVNILYENQKTIYDQLESVLAGLTSKPEAEALKAERGELNQVENDLKHVHELIGLQTMSARYEKISALIDGIWRTFFNKKIDGIFVTSDVVERLRNLPDLACERIGDCIKNADADVQFENSKFMINLNIPLSSSSNSNNLKLIETTSIPSDLDSQILLLKFPQKYFAFDANNKKIIALKENSLNLCRKSDDSTSSIMYCRAQDIIANVNTDECLEKAFRDKAIDSALCSKNMELLQNNGDFGVIEIGNGRYWVHVKNRKDVVIYCNKNDQEVKTFTQSQTFSLEFGCHALFRSDGIDLTSYVATDKSQKLKPINASISQADFIDIIETMEVSNYLRNGFQINLDAYQPKGLAPVEIKIELPQHAATSDELKTIRAQHSEALMFVCIIAVALMLYIAMSKGKPYIQKFLPPHVATTQKKDVESNEECEQNLNSNSKM